MTELSVSNIDLNNLPKKEFILAHHVNQKGEVKKKKDMVSLKRPLPREERDFQNWLHTTSTQKMLSQLSLILPKISAETDKFSFYIHQISMYKELGALLPIQLSEDALVSLIKDGWVYSVTYFMLVLSIWENGIRQSVAKKPLLSTYTCFAEKKNFSGTVWSSSSEHPDTYN